MSAKNAALAIGLVFLAVGLLGYVDNPIIGLSPGALFHADSVHNMVHLISGALFLLVALAAPGFAKTLMIIFGLVYLLIGIAGLVNTKEDGMGEVLGFLHVNENDNYLHIGLGLLIVFTGMLTRGSYPTVTR